MIYPLSGLRKEAATPPALLAKAGKYLSRFFRGIPRSLKTQKTYELANQMAHHRFGKGLYPSVRRGPFEVEVSPTDIKEGGWFDDHSRIFMFTPRDQKSLLRGYTVEKPVEYGNPFSEQMRFSSGLDLTHPGAATRKQILNHTSKQQQYLKSLGGK